MCESSVPHVLFMEPHLKHVATPATPFSAARHVSLFDRFKATFQAFDTEGSGNIGINDLRAFFEELGIPFSETQLAHVMHDFDENHDGAINYTEFIPLLRQMLQSFLKPSTEIKQMREIDEDGMRGLSDRLAARSVYNLDRRISHVVLIVVVLEEILPVLEHFQAKPDPDTEATLLSLAKAYSCTVGPVGGDDSYRLTVLQSATSVIYNRHYSGYSQAAAITALVARRIPCDLVVSFGTAGGVSGKAAIGDAIFASGCVFIDRLRTSSKTAHDWGVHGGPVVPAERMVRDLNLVEGLLGSQISYTVTPGQVHLMNTLGVVALDMEAAPEAQIASQTGLNFMALKMVSNGVHPGDGDRMEAEYREHKARVSAAGVQTLSAVLDYFRGRRLCDL
jgi:nucleoside phosphorylase